MKHKFEISYKTFFITAAIYLVLPVIIFFLGYLKIYWGLLFTAVIGVSFYLAIRDVDKDPEGKIKELKNVKFPVTFLVAAFIFAVFVTISNGVGEYMWGPYDHAFRRAILNDLIEYKWPIVYDPANQSNPVVISLLNLNGKQGFVYYFTYWLPSALVGKVFGFTAGNIALVIWNSFGIFITLIGMAIYLKRASYATLFTYLCFTGLHVIPYIVSTYIYPYEGWTWIDGWVPHISFVSNFNNLENVYNQVIPCYLIVVMIILAVNNRSLGFIASLIFAYSPWTTFGMIIPAAVRIFCPDLKASDKKQNLKNIFSVNNFMTPVILLFAFGFFYSAKSDSMHDQGFTWDYYGSIWKFIPVYLLFLVIEVLPVAVFAVRRHRRDPMFWAAVGVLLICPFYKITEMNDFVMRATMPALFILCLYVAQRISDYTAEDIVLARKGEKRKGVKENLKLAVFSLILIGMTYVTYFMMTVIYTQTFMTDNRFTYDIVSFGNIAKPDYAEKIKDQFFVENPDDSFFFNYLAR